MPRRRSPRTTFMKPGEKSPVFKYRHKIGCCDCGLMHVFTFDYIAMGAKAKRMRQSTFVKLMKELDVRVRFSAVRDEEGTRRLRRYKKYAHLKGVI